MSNCADVKLTEYSHGAGCGCKISPKLLSDILASPNRATPPPQLLVGYDSKDDAAVYDLGNGTSVISTTDFFMPIVDDPFEFGQIAATNAISDVYAMGGRPLMAISIFGWPINKLDADVAAQVIEGGRRACELAGIPLAGGHSIDSPEPIFGLAVTGQVNNEHIKQNNLAQPGCVLFLTKPLGIGILTTAQKKKLLRPEHQRLAPDVMCQLNTAGQHFGQLPQVKAMTDVTGFGLLGHLLEVCEGSGVHATIDFAAVPTLPAIREYLELGCSPGGAQRNFDSYGHKAAPLTEMQKKILCDPQTSGGLLVAVSPDGVDAFQQVATQLGMSLQPIGKLTAVTPSAPDIFVRLA
ncbi:MAG: selenide, water dikinase SelD [Gammaproteobacteria bacterium]|nr:selenide, water dikinase SelD [Gammaproteobacteria bacterium]